YCHCPLCTYSKNIGTVCGRYRPDELHYFFNVQCVRWFYLGFRNYFMWLFFRKYSNNQRQFFKSSAIDYFYFDSTYYLFGHQRENEQTKNAFVRKAFFL